MNKSEATKLWFKAAGIRAIKTVCQTGLHHQHCCRTDRCELIAVASASVLAGVLSLLILDRSA